MFTNDIIKSERALDLLEQKLFGAVLRWNILTRSDMTTSEAAERMYDVVMEWIDEQTTEIKFKHISPMPSGDDNIDGGFK